MTTHDVWLSVTAFIAGSAVTLIATAFDPVKPGQKRLVMISSGLALIGTALVWFGHVS
jgi:predicted membrane channel-forming protein YqfA (hemolysin III family)